MRLLYGVQATGNGHISRARAMARRLDSHGIQTDFLFSGRPADKLFEMNDFGRWQHRQGLTFVTKSGRVDYFQSYREANVRQLWSDIQNLDTHNYDLVVTDFEPVTAWAAKRQGTPVLAIGHQYAFLHPIPRQDDNWFNQQIFRFFAPADRHIGLHWDHFDIPQQPGTAIAPPIIDLPELDVAVEQDRVLVYLPFEDEQAVLQWLKPLGKYQFDIYGFNGKLGRQAHMHFHPPSVKAFKYHLAQASAVLSNAGFELISEALQWQKKILVKPLQGQMEQASNALALTQLQLAHQTQQLNTDTIAHWLAGPRAPESRHYPDVAAEICRQINVHGSFDSQALWQQTKR